MGKWDDEKLLAIFYPLIIAFGFICSVTVAIAWSHWKYVLDTCVEVNCGCILNGISTITYFTGGHVAYCYWATFGLIVPMLVAIVFGVYHVFRVCMTSGKRQRQIQQTVRQRSGDILVVATRSEKMPNNDISPYYWIPAATFAAIMVVYVLVHAAMLTVGFLQSCHQYRNELIKYTRASGPMVLAVQGRITCASVFDFMDFLHPDVSFDRRRIDRIHTAACLVLALISVWISVALWIGVLVINIMQARRTKSLRV